MRLKNNYFLLRHGEAISNKMEFVSCWPEKTHNPLTAKGKKQVESVAAKLKNEKIDLILASDILRTKQTAEIVAKKLKLGIKFNKKLRESKFGRFNNKPGKEWKTYLHSIYRRPADKNHREENYYDIRMRMENFLRDTEKKYRNKNILIVTHGALLFALEAIMKNIAKKDEKKHEEELKFKNAQLEKIC